MEQRIRLHAELQMMASAHKPKQQQQPSKKQEKQEVPFEKVALMSDDQVHSQLSEWMVEHNPQLVNHLPRMDMRTKRAYLEQSFKDEVKSNSRRFPK